MKKHLPLHWVLSRDEGETPPVKCIIKYIVFDT